MRMATIQPGLVLDLLQAVGAGLKDLPAPLPPGTPSQTRPTEEGTETATQTRPAEDKPSDSSSTSADEEEAAKFSRTGSPSS